MKTRRIDLIGYRGAGKSTVGTILAERLGWGFVDSDREIEKQTGKTIVELFALDVEWFRQLETELMQKVADRFEVVIAWGGGVILSAVNRQMLGEQFCVWLTARADDLFRRVAADPNTETLRPALTEAGGLAEVKHVLAIREPLYAEVASLTIHTDTVSPPQVAEQIHNHLLKHMA